MADCILEKNNLGLLLGLVDGGGKNMRKLEQISFKKVQKNLFKIPVLYCKTRCDLYFI